MEAVTKENSIAEVLEKHPFLSAVFTRHGLHCVDCIITGVDCIVGADTIEKRADWYGIVTDELVEELNQTLVSECEPERHTA